MSFISTYRVFDPATDEGEQTQPLSELEKLFARELHYAAAELKSLGQNAQAEPHSQAAYSRASRSLRRAQRELSRIRAIPAGRVARYTPQIQRVARAAPLAEPSCVPMPIEPVSMERHALELISQGKIRSDIFTAIRQQEEK